MRGGGNSDRNQKENKPITKEREEKKYENLPSVTTGKRSLNPGGRTHLAGRISRMKNKSARRVNTFCLTELQK